jgi:hypothetical protein
VHILYFVYSCAFYENNCRRRVYPSGAQPQVATQITVGGAGGGGCWSDVGSREGFMENLIIMKQNQNVSKYRQNDRENVIIESPCINLKN